MSTLIAIVAGVFAVFLGIFKFFSKSSPNVSEVDNKIKTNEVTQIKEEQKREDISVSLKEKQKEVDKQDAQDVADFFNKH